LTADKKTVFPEIKLDFAIKMQHEQGKREGGLQNFGGKKSANDFYNLPPNAVAETTNRHK